MSETASATAEGRELRPPDRGFAHGPSDSLNYSPSNENFGRRHCRRGYCLRRGYMPLSRKYWIFSTEMLFFTTTLWNFAELYTQFVHT